MLSIKTNASVPIQKGRRVSTVEFISPVNTANLLTNISEAVLNIKQNNLNFLKNTLLADIGNKPISKWIDIEESKSWLKINGLSTGNIPMRVKVIGGNPVFEKMFDADGVFNSSIPLQKDVFGVASKIRVTGLGEALITLFTNVTYSNAYAGYALYPPGSRQIYLAPNGMLYTVFSMIYDGSPHSRAIFGESDDGGLNWTRFVLNVTATEGDAHTTMAVDKYGNIYFVWAETNHENLLIDIIYSKLNMLSNVFENQNIITTINPDLSFDFTEFTESDAASEITVASSEIDFNFSLNTGSDAYVVASLGSSIDGYEARFILHINSIEIGGSIILCALTDELNAPYSCKAVWVDIERYQWVSTGYRIRIKASDGIDIDTATTVLESNTDIYCKLIHPAGGNTVRLIGYDNADMTNIVINMTLTSSYINYNKSYLYALYLNKMGITGSAIGNISNLNLNERNVSPMAQLDADGSTIKVCWLGSMFNKYPNLYGRSILPDGSLTPIETISTWGSDIYYMEYVTMDIDSNGYRHMMFITRRLTTNNFNLYYVYENASGWQPAQLLNSELDEQNLAHYMSNILINIDDHVYIAYDVGPFDSTSKTPLYLREIINGVIGSRITVQPGNPDVGGTIPYMQFDKDYNINIVYMSNTSPDTYNTRKIINGVVGEKHILYTVEDGRDLSYMHTPINIAPKISNVRPNISQENLFFIFADYATGVPGAVDIKLGYTAKCIMGAPAIAPRVRTKSYNIRGCINRSKFNNFSGSPIH